MIIKPAKNIVITTQAPQENDVIALGYEGPKDRPEIGIVYAVGTGTLPIKIKVGDRVVYRKYSESEVFIGNKKYNFLDFKDIVAVVAQEAQFDHEN